MPPKSKPTTSKPAPVEPTPAVPARLTVAEIKAVFIGFLSWLCTMADGTVKSPVMLPSGLTADGSKNSPQRLAYRCDGARVSIAGMVGAQRHGWTMAAKSWPVIGRLSAGEVEAAGLLALVYGTEVEPFTLDILTSTGHTDGALIGALWQASRDDVANPVATLVAALAPKVKAESGPKVTLSDAEQQTIKALLGLPVDHPMHASGLDSLTAEAQEVYKARRASKDAKAAIRAAAEAAQADQQNDQA
ncbi:hypothetical protein ACIBH1_45310 [Nonomuraea sp. NPDC050663]|uniref:hypothetical protein n=1 Tax=Nonomuraea sp. NPDC050663 TaxID=3364370 RepID=UPI0037AA2F7A